MDDCPSPFSGEREVLIPLAAHSRRDSMHCWGGKKALLSCLMICRYRDWLGLGLFKRNETGLRFVVMT